MIPAGAMGFKEWIDFFSFFITLVMNLARNSFLFILGILKSHKIGKNIIPPKRHLHGLTSRNQAMISHPRRVCRKHFTLMPDTTHTHLIILFQQDLTSSKSNTRIKIIYCFIPNLFFHLCRKCKLKLGTLMVKLIRTSM